MLRAELDEAQPKIAQAGRCSDHASQGSVAKDVGGAVDRADHFGVGVDVDVIVAAEGDRACGAIEAELENGATLACALQAWSSREHAALSRGCRGSHVSFEVLPV